jgi:hypothetical protein
MTPDHGVLIIVESTRGRRGDEPTEPDDSTIETETEFEEPADDPPPRLRAV